MQLRVRLYNKGIPCLPSVVWETQNNISEGLCAEILKVQFGSPLFFHTDFLCPSLFYLSIYLYLTCFSREMILWVHRPNLSLTEFGSFYSFQTISTSQEHLL